MYEQSFKFGQAIIVSGSRSCVGTSTAAAMIASTLANGGEKVLLLTTDYTHPTDATSLLSDAVVENHMDELVALENSSGLTPENLEDYTTYLTDNLAYTRLSTKLSSITRDVPRTLSRIMDTACRVYRYVVLDLDYQSAVYLRKLSEQADIVALMFGQDFHSLAVAKAMKAQEQSDTGALLVPVLMNALEDIPFNDELLAKSIGADMAFTIEHDAEVYKAAQKRDIAGFVARGKNKAGLKGLFKKRSADDEPESAAQVSFKGLCDLIKEALAAETGGEA